MRVVLVSHDVGDNAMGRAWVLWETLHRAGVPAIVVGRTRGGVWPPIRSTPMGDATSVLSRESAVRDLRQRLRRGDVLYAVKARPGSFGLARRAAGGRHQILLDVDEDDFGALLGRHAQSSRRPRNVLSMLVRKESPFEFWRLQGHVTAVPLTVSSPILQESFGHGTIVPHARHPRPDPGHRERGASGPLTVTFVGTPRAHKGITVLRDAVATLGHTNRVRLVATAPPPRDARAWEDWVGTTSLGRGLDLVDRSDVIVVPSTANEYAQTQLPAKVIDGMMAGRAVVASDTPPIRWALGDSGILVTPGSADELRASLETLANPDVRADLGRRARDRALRMFTFDAVVPSVMSVLERVTQ